MAAIKSSNPDSAIADSSRPQLADSGLALEASLQLDYYRATASSYDHLHLKDRDEHAFALRILSATIAYYPITSILDIGAGTGRVARFIKQHHPALRVVSVEPVCELRDIAKSYGLAKEDVLDGDATCLQFGDGEFDLVTEFGALHHIRYPSAAVKEMLRVCKIGVFISDCNNFGQGSVFARISKQVLRATKLWKVANKIKTRGKGYSISSGDGLAYSYSVFSDYKQVAKQCHTYILNTQPSGINPYRTASHVALLGIKKRNT
jgi:ubiquinone/menaquinone biosynthesis C-methylase UbiE